MRRLAGFCVMMIIFFSFMAANHSFSQNIEQRQKVINQIVDAADRICYVIQQYGSSTSSEASGEIGAALTGLARRLADAGVSAHGRITSREYRGVLQENLADSIYNSAKCKLDAIKLLNSIIPRNDSKRDSSDPRWIRNHMAARLAEANYLRGEAGTETVGDWKVHVEDLSHKQKCYAYTRSNYNSFSKKISQKGVLMLSFDSDGDVYITVRTAMGMDQDSDTTATVRGVPYELGSDGALAFIVSVESIRSLMSDWQDEHGFSVSYKHANDLVREYYSVNGLRNVIRKITRSCLKDCGPFDLKC